jgi:hypothetical protein
MTRFEIASPSDHGKNKQMDRIQDFQAAAYAGGFIELNECADGTVLWLRKSPPGTNRDTHQRMCIDRVTNSVTIFWMNAPGKVSARTFRNVPALQQWFELRPQTILERWGADGHTYPGR